MWCSSRLPLTVAQAQPPDSNVNLPGTQGEPTDGSPVPTCFRHPGRETYVSCVRCGRHACPDCLRAAPVGQQCVECVREGSRDAPTARTVFGGRMAAGTRVTWVLMAINIIVYVGELANNKLIHYFEMVGRAYDPVISSHLVGV